MVDKSVVGEMRFLRALYPGEFSERCLAIPYKHGSQALRRQLQQHISAALKTLSYRERGIIEMRYGFGDGFLYTLAQAGYVFRLTRERVRQLQARTLRKLRVRAKALESFLREMEGRDAEDVG